MVVVLTSEDAYAHMDRLEQRIRQLRVSYGGMVWDDSDGLPMVSLLTKFRMPKIEWYMGIGCPHIHLRLYSTVMRAHDLDEAHMIMLFPLSFSGATQRWFASLDVSRRCTWDDLAEEFLWQFAFNTVIDISWRELEALRQRPDSFSIGERRLPRSLIGHLRGVRSTWLWGAWSLDLLDIWWDSHTWTLDIWCRHYMVLRRVLLEDCGLSLSFKLEGEETDYWTEIRGRQYHQCRQTEAP